VQPFLPAIRGCLKGDQVAYIKLWLKALKGDKKFIFQVASHAQKAVDYLGKRRDYSCA
jgi:antirestriction protein ArdC